MTTPVPRREGKATAPRPRCRRDLDDDQFAIEIEAIWECSARTYGAPRVHAWLRRQGFRVARKRVARIMRQRVWYGVSGRRRVRTTVVDRAATAASDLVARNFDPVAPDLTWPATSPMSPPGRAGCSWPRSSTCSPAG